MPIYEYKCDDCGVIFDFLMIEKSENPSCPKCGSRSLSKKLTAPARISVENAGPSGTT